MFDRRSQQAVLLERRPTLRVVPSQGEVQESALRVDKARPHKKSREGDAAVKIVGWLNSRELQPPR
jgi:hypothetical protein